MFKLNNLHKFMWQAIISPANRTVEIPDSDVLPNGRDNYYDNLKINTTLQKIFMR